MILLCTAIVINEPSSTTAYRECRVEQVRDTATYSPEDDAAQKARIERMKKENKG